MHVTVHLIPGRKQFKSFLFQQELDRNLVSSLLSSPLGKPIEPQEGKAYKLYFQ